MKKLFVMAAMVLSSVGAFAQQAAGTTTIQPKVGLNVSTIGDNDWKAGFAAGAELQYQATSNFGVAVGALYSVQGFKGKDIEIDTPIVDGTIQNDYKWNPGYINVPITLNYYPVAGLALKAGLQPGFLVNKDDMDDAKTVDLSIPVGLSYEYQGIVFDARYNIGVTKIADNVDHYNNVIPDYCRLQVLSLINELLVIPNKEIPVLHYEERGFFFLVISV